MTTRRSKSALKFGLSALLVCVVAFCLSEYFLHRVWISHGYYLEDLGESQRIIVVGKLGKDELGGVFEGHVMRIGWNNRHVLAYVKPHSAGDATGWYVLDVDTGATRGPLNTQELEAYSDIKTVSGEDALKGSWSP